LHALVEIGSAYFLQFSNKFFVKTPFIDYYSGQSIYLFSARLGALLVPILEQFSSEELTPYQRKIIKC